MKKVILPILALIFIQNENIYSQSGWFLLNSGTTHYMNTVVFLNENTGYVGADVGELLITTNAGVNWTISFTGTVNSWLMDIHFLNNSTAYIAGSGGGVFKTTNGGINLIHISDGSVSQIYFSSFDTGYYSSKYNGIFKTINAGINWSNVKPNYRQLESGVHFFNNSTGFVAGDQKLYKTVNGGISWDSIDVVSGDFFISDLQFMNNSTGFLCIGYANGGVYKTTNSGNNWFQLYNSQMKDLYFINENTGFAVSYYNRFIKTTNSGVNWVVIDDNFFSNPTGVHFVNENTGYIVTTVGKILKTTNGGTPIGITPINTELPSDFALEQNYPNPFNPVTNIKFSIPKSGLVRISVFDLTGREIALIINMTLALGSYKADFDGKGLPTGVYFYKMEIKDFTQTKKMVLVK